MKRSVPDIQMLSPPASVNMASDWFDLVDENHFWMAWRARVVLGLAKEVPLGSGRLLEVGCGSGVFRAQAEATLGLTVDGCDLDPDALRRARPGSGRLMVYNVFDRLDSMSQAYDGLLLMDVLEHTSDDSAFLEASLHCARPGALVLVNVPAAPALFSRYDVAAGHQRRYTKATLLRLFDACGVEPISIAPWGLTLVPVLGVRKLALRFVGDEDVIRVGFVPPAGWVGAVFGALMRVETSLSLRMPYGASIAAVGRLRAR